MNGEALRLWCVYGWCGSDVLTLTFVVAGSPDVALDLVKSRRVDDWIVGLARPGDLIDLVDHVSRVPGVPVARG